MKKFLRIQEFENLNFIFILFYFYNFTFMNISKLTSIDVKWLKEKAKLTLTSWLVALWLWTVSEDVEAKSHYKKQKKWFHRTTKQVIKDTKDHLYELLVRKNLISGSSLKNKRTSNNDEQFFEPFVEEPVNLVTSQQQYVKSENVSHYKTHNKVPLKRTYNKKKKVQQQDNTQVPQQVNQVENTKRQSSFKKSTQQNQYKKVEQDNWSFNKTVYRNSNLNSSKWLILDFNWRTYDLSQFQNKVLKPLTYTERFYWKDFNEYMVMKLWFIENMWKMDTSEKQFWRVLRKFEWNNYRKLMSVVSHAWAKWVFQIMDNTRNWLNRIYNVDNIFNQNYQHIKQKFWLDDLDMEILRNAVHSAFTVEDIWSYRDHETISWMYNMWPRYLKVSKNRLNSETKWYIEKHQNVDRFLRSPWMMRVKDNKQLILSKTNDEILMNDISNIAQNYLDKKEDVANSYNENIEFVASNTRDWVNWILNFYWNEIYNLDSKFNNNVRKSFS